MNVPSFWISMDLWQCFEFRYHYFLQLKKDVIDGRMSCDTKQAVLLASYSMQGKVTGFVVLLL